MKKFNAGIRQIFFFFFLIFLNSQKGKSLYTQISIIGLT